MEVVLEFEGRSKLVKLKKSAKETDLRLAFESLCKSDPVLRRRTVTHYATFHTYHARLKRLIELDSGESLKNNQVVKVHFASYATMDLSDDVTNSGEGLESSALGFAPTHQSIEIMDSADAEEMDFMLSSGLHTHEQTGNSTPSTSTGRQRKQLEPTATAPASQPLPVSSKEVPRRKPGEKHQTKRNRQQNDTDEQSSASDDEQYLRDAEKSRESNQERLRLLDINSTLVGLSIPKLKKKKRKTKDNAAGKENRVMPPRAVKSKHAAPPTIIADEDNENETVDDNGLSPEQEAEQETIQGPLGGITDKVVVPKKKRRTPQKKRRRIGQKITKFTPLPEFPQCLKDSIKKNLVYAHQQHTKRMNDFLKAHILKITGDLYCTRGEHRILKDQVINRLRLMNVQNIKLYQKKLIRSLSASTRNKRNYLTNKLPKLRAEREIIQLQKEAEAQTRDEIRELDANEANTLLMMPVMNKETVKRALSAESATIRNNYMRMHSLREAIEAYPYLKDTELLLYDYATRVPSTLDLMKNNFESSLSTLASVLSADRSTDELQKLRLIEKINDYFQEDEDNNFPCVQLWDEANLGADPLNNIPAAQAPALVVMVNDKDIISAVLVFDGECLYTVLKPSSFDCVALLISGYFVFQIEYPKPYEKQLYTLQHIVHGERNYHSVVKNFFRTFTRAKKILSQHSST